MRSLLYHLTPLALPLCATLIPIMWTRRAFVAATAGFAACNSTPDHDLVIRGGTVFDGSGAPGREADIAIAAGRIARISTPGSLKGKSELDAKGMAVAPGFINMMCHANESLIIDGRSMSDIKQGVTLEVMGEGTSMGPLSDAMKQEKQSSQGDLRYKVEWTTLGDYLRWLEKQGVSPNVASFIGAATPRIYVIGYADRAPTEEELSKMRELVRVAMREGAMGVASSLIYPPGSFASIEELIALAKAAAEYKGLYASHLRNEGALLLQALDEFLRIVKEAGIRGEIYHLKAAGRNNWPLMDQAIEKIEQARAQGLEVTADVYTYPAGATGLNASIPPWVQEGGFGKSLQRMKDPSIRRQIVAEMKKDSDQWENMYLGAGSPEGILLTGFTKPELKQYTGKTLAEIAKLRNKPPEETAMDLIIEDNSRIGTVYFTQSEENLRKNIRQPWVSFCSDSPSLAAEGVFLESSTHPRAYGSFARLLGKYVREEKLISLQEAIRKLSHLPAQALGLKDRGLLKENYAADIVVFDPATIQDHATYADPHQYATGVKHVVVNGVPVIQDTEHTGAKPGQFVKGPGAA